MVAPALVVKCEGHDELVRQAGMTLASTQEHAKQLSRVFEKLDTISTAIDQGKVRAEIRDESIEAIAAQVKEIDRKIENGIRTDIRKCADSIARMAECSERRRKQREEMAKAGLLGFLSVGFERFRANLSFVLVTGGFLFVLWLLVSHPPLVEGPSRMFKLFGIG
jgi:hypothetical protein